MPDFKVSWWHAYQEIGWAGIRLLRQLRKRLGLKNGYVQRRIAPSPVMRSESLLFGVSMPRFAIRCYLDPEHRNFVNVRRIGTFCDRLQVWGGRRKAANNWHRLEEHHEERVDDLLGQSPAWVVRKSSCIGDSVLTAPSEIAERYHVLTAELGRTYGETPRSDGSSLIGTPFINHIILSGGGLCAQAVCFMATTLCQSFLTGAHGVAEITAMVGAEGRNEIPLSGLNYRQIAAYLRRVGSSATWQRAERNWITPERLFATAVRAYIHSNIPVIALTDLGRMCGQDRLIQTDGLSVDVDVVHRSIYARNSMKGHLRSAEHAEPLNHAILIIGCHRTANLDEFLINDPASFPFFKASAVQLWDVASYRRTPLSGGVEGRAQGSKSDPSFYLNRGMILPVTPADVRLSLQEIQGDREGDDGIGLFRLAQVLQKHPSALPVNCGTGTFNPGHFQLQHVPNWRFADRIPGMSSFVEDCGTDIAERIGAPHWCWVQYVPRGTWQGHDDLAFVWDAELVNPRGKTASEVKVADALRYLLMIFQRRSGKWQLVSNVSDPAPSRPARRLRATPRMHDHNYRNCLAMEGVSLRPSLISSFSHTGGDEAAAHWPCGVIDAAELYLLMQSDAERVLARRRPSPCESQPYRYFFRALYKNVLSWWPFQRIREDYPDKTSAHRWLRWYERRQAHALRWPLITAMERMAAMEGTDSALRIARKLALPFEKRGIQVVALATFLPEIVCSKKVVAENAQRALGFALELAYALRRLGHPVAAIEMVSGSLIDGIWRVAQRHGMYVANRISFAEAAGRLRDNLVPIAVKSKALFEQMRSAEGAKRDNLTEQVAALGPVSISLELEPGPLNVLNNLRRLTRFAKMICERTELRDVVGYNLDVAHFALANTSADELWACPEVRTRIVHAHLSDSPKGHYGDVVPLEINSQEFFDQWLETIYAIAAEQRQAPQPNFSGIVSLELEACKSSELVSRGAEIAHGLITRPSQLLKRVAPNTPDGSTS